jgi:BlaI family transcriptional regulator, penicillinase repressor
MDMHELNENEKEALRVLWELGAVKPADIQAAFGWSIENATLRSVLRNLVEKGFVTRNKVGKAFLYRARSRRGALFSQAMQRMAEIFTGGSKADLILELLKREKLSPQDLAALQEIANRKQSKPDNS